MEVDTGHVARRIRRVTMTAGMMRRAAGQEMYPDCFPVRRIRRTFIPVAMVCPYGKTGIVSIIPGIPFPVYSRVRDRRHPGIISVRVLYPRVSGKGGLSGIDNIKGIW